jgi:hypothetical protein
MPVGRSGPSVSTFPGLVKPLKAGSSRSICLYCTLFDGGG